MSSGLATERRIMHSQKPCGIWGQVNSGFLRLPRLQIGCHSPTVTRADLTRVSCYLGRIDLARHSSMRLTLNAIRNRLATRLLGILCIPGPLTYSLDRSDSGRTCEL